MATTNLLHPLTLLALATVLLAGCAQLGPRALSEGRPLYNVAVQRTEAEQLLLNIVRQRYSDPVLFLDVTSIASGFSGQANVGWSSRVFESVTESASAVLGGSLRENPNIFYAPNTGEKFVRQMLTLKKENARLKAAQADSAASLGKVGDLPPGGARAVAAGAGRRGH